MDKKHYDTFPWRLEHGTAVCHFQCKEHLQKYLDRYKLKTRQCNIIHKDGEPFESRKKHKKDLESSTKKSSNRSSGPSKRRTTRVDSARNITRTPRKKK